MGIPYCIGNQNLGSFMHLDLLAVSVNSISLKRKKYSLPCSSKIKRLAIYGAQFTNWLHFSILLNVENMKQATKQGTLLIISDPQNSAQDATVWNNNFSVLSNLRCHNPPKNIFSLQVWKIWSGSIIPRICPYWYTTALFRPVKIHQKCANTRPPESPVQRTFSHIFGIIASRNDQTRLPPSFITFFIAFVDVLNTNKIKK